MWRMGTSCRLRGPRPPGSNETLGLLLSWGPDQAVEEPSALERRSMRRACCCSVPGLPSPRGTADALLWRHLGGELRGLTPPRATLLFLPPHVEPWRAGGRMGGLCRAVRLSGGERL